MNTVGYYPGCSWRGSAGEYDLSIRELAALLDIDLKEIPDWVCCGATSAHAIHQAAAFSLAADTLVKARQADLQRVLAPCAMCYSRLAQTVHIAKHKPALAQAATRELTGTTEVDISHIQVINVLTWLMDLPPATLAARVKLPLKNLKVACYYGCLLVRPPRVTGANNPEYPDSMEAILSQVGAEPVRWAMATECCSGAFSLSCKPAVLRQGRQIFDAARASGADVIAVACPMCHSNLDMRQSEYAAGCQPMPILYVTQLLSLAFGITPEALHLAKHFVPVLEHLKTLEPSCRE